MLAGRRRRIASSAISKTGTRRGSSRWSRSLRSLDVALCAAREKSPRLMPHIERMKTQELPRPRASQNHCPAFDGRASCPELVPNVSGSVCGLGCANLSGHQKRAKSAGTAGDRTHAFSRHPREPAVRIRVVKTASSRQFTLRQRQCPLCQRWTKCGDFPGLPSHPLHVAQGQKPVPPPLRSRSAALGSA